jgi:hypothetical protein
MEPSEINSAMARQEDGKLDLAEVEKVDDVEVSKSGAEVFTPEEEKRLVRKLDFWSVAMKRTLPEKPLTISKGSCLS